MIKKNYESVFILTPVLSEEQIKDTVNKYIELLKNNESDIVFIDKPKLKKLSYPIKNKTMGIYQIIEFASSPDLIKTFEKELRRDETIIRFLTVSLDKHAIAYNKKKKELDTEKKDISSPNKEDSKNNINNNNNIEKISEKSLTK